VPIDPRSSADDATRLILRHFLAIIEANRSGVCDAVDSEFLHDLRVATRRTRSLLRGTRQVLPAHVVSQFAGEFRWLSGITSGPRDLDVYLLELPDYADRLPGTKRSALEPLRELLETRRHREYSRLETLLGSERFIRLMEGWRKYLERGKSRRSPALAVVPVAEFASGVIWKAHKRVLRRGRQIADDSPSQLLHELRKDSKRLRYLMEAFSSLYPASQVAKGVGRLRALQSVLGGHQDIFVHMVALRELASDLARNGASGETVEAIKHLANSLSAEGAGHRGRFAEAFAKYDSAKNRSVARSLFRQRTAT
jgi:CHAD domain-containing protein